MFTNKFTLTLSEKVVLPNGKKQHKEVGKCEVPFPTLQDFGIPAEQAKDKEGKPAFEEGVPLYTDPKLDWLQGAIVFRHAANVRNKFSGGKLKAGMSLPEDFDALLEQVGRSGDALALRREAKASFEAFLQARGKSAGTIAALSELFFNSAKVLSTASPKYIEGLAVQVGKWIEQLPEDRRARFQPKIAELQESINAAQGEDSLDDMAN